jgi:hypothetical protein
MFDFAFDLKASLFVISLNDVLYGLRTQAKERL